MTNLGMIRTLSGSQVPEPERKAKPGSKSLPEKPCPSKSKGDCIYVKINKNQGFIDQVAKISFNSTPDESSKKVVSDIKRISAKCPILMLTGDHNCTEDYLQATGVDGVIFKPFQVDEFLNKINRYLES